MALDLQVLNKFKKDPAELKSNVLICYICKELFSYFVVSFLFLFVVFFANQILLIGESLLSKRAPFKDVAMVMIYSLPMLISQSIPFATLIGFLMCLGRMMSDNEILIMRASGFGYRYIFLPVLTLGIIISLFTFFTNDYLTPLSKIKYNKLMTKIAQSTPTIVLEPNSVKSIGRSMVVIGDVEGSNVSDVIFFNSEENGTESIIIAGESKLTDSKQDGVLLQLDMSDALMLSVKTSNRRNYDVLNSENILMNIFDTTFTGGTIRSPSELTSSDLRKEINRMKESSGDSKRLNTWKMEYYKKFAIPFIVICFSVLAFAVAFLFGKNNGLTMGLLIGVIISVFYWAIQISGQLLVVHVQMNSFWCIWLPDIILGTAGLVLSLVHVLK